MARRMGGREGIIKGGRQGGWKNGREDRKVEERNGGK